MVLKHKDRELLRFEWTGDNVKVVSVNETSSQWLPPEFSGGVTDNALFKWIKGRAIPANRQYVQSFLAKVGLNERDIRGIITLCRGLSLNDVYWVADNDSAGDFASVNLYRNKFSPALAAMAFTGAGTFSTPDLVSSPEFTTNGMLAKCWRRIDGDVLLFKSGTEGAANTGNEPYSEFYAAQVADAMGLDHVEYGLSRFKGRLCSTCRLFTSEETGFIAASRLMAAEQAVADERFTDMFLFDAVIFNEDRHLGNFGFLVKNKTNEIGAVAPLFDHGNALFSKALFSAKYPDDFADLPKYAATRRPALYGDWLSPLRGKLTPRRKRMLENVSKIEFRKHDTYNLPARRLAILQQFVRDRAASLIGELSSEFRVQSSEL